MPVKASHLAAWLIGQDLTTTTVSKSNNQITDQLTDRYLLRLLLQAFGFLSSILFVVDMVLNYRVFQTQRAQEIPPEQGMQLLERRVWDINYEYLKSPVFYVKLVEMVRNGFYYMAELVRAKKEFTDWFPERSEFSYSNR